MNWAKLPTYFVMLLTFSVFLFFAQAVEEMEKLKAQNSKAEVKRKYHIAMTVV